MAQYTSELVEQVAHAVATKHNLPDIYHSRIHFECIEISKQGAWSIWLSYLNENKKFETNPNKLVIPWLLRMLAVKTGDKTYRPLTQEEWLAADPIATRDVAKDGPVMLTSHYQDVNKLPTLPIDIHLDPDKPDIDLDCLPEARDILKAYAAEKYNEQGKLTAEEEDYGYVCSVGTWTTYKFKSALQDVHKAYGHTEKSGKQEIFDLTTNLPEDVDTMPDGGYSVCKNRVKNDKGDEVDCNTRHNLAHCPKCGSDTTDAPTIGKLLDQHEILRKFYDIHQDIVDRAVGLVGRIRGMGMHAGAIIIADRPLYGNLPLNAKRGKDDEAQWISMWTEGRNTQLSKLGFIKWDILGLKNLKYIQECCKLIEVSSNGAITFSDGSNPIGGWDFVDPIKGTAGCYWKVNRKGNRVKVDISLNDKDALHLATESMTDGIFQFDTPLAKQILSNGVKTFEDLMLFNAMGHPGPMDSIPEAVANRDGENPNWKADLRAIHPTMLEILESTHGQIVYQEQLAQIWQGLAGFTSPEAQDARKAVAKKWKHLLLPIEGKWMSGATKMIGMEQAALWWNKMVSFARYAFNRSHAVAYCSIAYKCLWLKAHHPAEWWAAVMSGCHPDKLSRYVATAKSEKQVKFGPLNINNLTHSYTVTAAHGDELPVVNQGLIGIKGIGEKTSALFTGVGNWGSIDEFVLAHPKSKRVMERLIKLGSFEHMHPNRHGTWRWYLYQYGTDSSDEVKNVRKVVDMILRNRMHKTEWPDDAIRAQRRKMAEEYHRQFPKKTAVPPKIRDWQPTLIVRRDDVIGLWKEWSAATILDFERQYVGYYLTNPLERYEYSGNNTIAQAMDYEQGIVHAVVTKVEYAKTKNEDTMCRVYINDGQDEILVLVWDDECREYEPELKACEAALMAKAPEVGISIAIKWSGVRHSATVFRQSRYKKTASYDRKSISLLPLLGVK